MSTGLDMDPGPKPPSTAPDQFYTGLVAELYDPLAGYRARADEYAPFLDRSGTPALELCCGSGRPLLELRERGYDVDGLDASRDMLDRCRADASTRGLEVTLYEATMQSFALPRRYRAIFLAGGSFMLLPSDEDAARTLRCMHDHLMPGGAVMIPVPAHPERRPATNHGPEGPPWHTTESGDRVRCFGVASHPSADGRAVTERLRYERIPAHGPPEVLERDFHLRYWSQDAFRELLLGAGFADFRFRDPRGGPARPDLPMFVVLARK
jgi:SAM-dependent methyltransferase